MCMKALPLFFFLALTVSGCSRSSLYSAVTGEQIAVIPYDPNCLSHWQQGREYVAQGRYELAREQYLMALAASNTEETSTQLSHELHSVDMMITTQR